MKKVYTELYYQSDCGNYKIHCEEDDTYGIFFEESDIEHWVDMDSLISLHNFLSEFLKENNKLISQVAHEELKQPAHDPRFAPDPDGVLGL